MYAVINEVQFFFHHPPNLSQSCAAEVAVTPVVEPG
jgi:hypothetical protein